MLRKAPWLILLALVVLSSGASAQDPAPARPLQRLQERLRQQQQQQDAHPLQRWLRSQMALLGRLGLTPEQQGQLRAIPPRYETEWQELNRRVRQARNGFQRVLASDADVRPEIIEERARAIGATEGEMARLVAQIWNEVRQILTPEQRRRLQEIRVEMQRQQRLQRQTDEPTDAPARPATPNPQPANNLRRQPARRANKLAPAPVKP
jgi:Spy/CpxP family protein refolding chaperone